ncbi:VCBS repeat-containing protein [Chryseolinea sp. Jin1]|uniref:VCBS repeat-containing protein n=2 Tax=Chryseolinea lacunae TaxID=2801331 RepID=A0ABS1KW09_9BACT|nr:VCBS repeat-containing protein [Chryseolinea lacunae]
MACSEKNDKKFRFVPSSESGITFRNVLKESVEFNIFNYMYFYNGGGVATGDVNGDGLPDIYFTANQDPNKLYLNQGDFKFKDITQESGVEGFHGWTTGVTMADVNNDGKLDIYVGYLGDYLIFKGKNQLFINEGNDANGVPKFTDRAMEFGLDLVGFATQASFFDYDRDGDLDMFMLNHSLHENGTFGMSKNLKYQSHPLAGDKLMRNDDGHFLDVTKTSGILDNAIGYGLGIVVSDVNMDGWPDVYIGNDFHENDYLYINQKNGTFQEVLEKQMNHTSRYTMGVDFADFNNDAFPDLMAMDMLPEDPFILKASAAEDAYDLFDFKLRYGYNYQYTRNALQLNNQDGTFSEIGLYAGVSATDWSWSTLFADFDLDGQKDIFISNGILRRSNDLDYINFITTDSIQDAIKFNLSEKHLKLIEKMPKIKLANFLYRNNGDSTFTNKAIEWGLDKISYSHGAAYVDLDNDGDLDLVTNNVEDEAFVMENLFRDKNKAAQQNHSLKVVLKGASGNLYGLGTKVFLYHGGKVQLQECTPVRGYQSAVDTRMIFGTGQNITIDSVVVVWPTDACEVLKNVKTDQVLEVAQENAKSKFDYGAFHHAKPLFEETTAALGIDFVHKENKFVEFTREALLPHMLSAEGPAAAVGDVNNDGLDDIFIGGAKWQTSELYVQTKQGTFLNSVQKVFAQDSVQEDVDAAFADVDGDGDQDLIVVTGGNEFTGNSVHRQPKLYTNDGKGIFAASKGLPEMYITGSSVSVSDFDSDHDLDLFIAVRTIPYKYGEEPDNYLLQNDGKGNFTDVTAEAAPALKHFGFIKQSVWADIDNDKDEDLILAAEWKPVTILINTGGKLSPLSLAGSGLEQSNGWWNHVALADFDTDGDLDIIAGNLGLNSTLKTSLTEPVRMYYSDFDANGSSEQILTHYTHGKEYPYYTRDEMVKQMPGLKKKYLSSNKFAAATFKDIFNEDTLKKAKLFEVFTFESAYVENKGNGKFVVKPLPSSAQFSTVNATVTEDFNHDGNLDVFVAGNFYPINIQMGRYDASYGTLLLGNGKGAFTAVPNKDSGACLKGEIRKLKPVKAGERIQYVGFRNNDTLVSFSLKK